MLLLSKTVKKFPTHLLKQTLLSSSLSALFLFGALSLSAQDQSVPEVSANSLDQEENSLDQVDSEMKAFIDDLLSQMTLEEKIGQLNLATIGFDVTGPTISEDVEEKIKLGLVGAVFNNYTQDPVKKLQKLAVENTRLGIPLLFGFDVIHGHRTIFPMPIGLAATWDMDLIEETARVAATEAAAEGLNWTFSPMVDLSRDPRWGRTAEGAGEDPYLGAKIAESMVQGYEGTDLSDKKTLLSTVKHFALYGAAEGGRDYNTTDMSHLVMHNTFFPPYKAAIDAGAGSVMTSFNEVDGVPATGSHFLLQEVLRDQWGFEGMVVTDYTSIKEIVYHRSGDDAKAAEMSINAGSDMDMVSELYLDKLPELVEQGRVTEETIDKSVRRILEAKYKLGLFEDPYHYINEGSEDVILSSEHKEVAKRAAQSSFVLLKNAVSEGSDKAVLPLSGDEKIALVGPLAKSQRDLIGNWTGGGRAEDAISLYDGLVNLLGEEQVLYAHGANVAQGELLRLMQVHHGGNYIHVDDRSKEELIEEALSIAEEADVIVAAVGESQGMSGEGGSRTSIQIPGYQRELIQALSETGKPLVLVIMAGRPLDLRLENEAADAMLFTWFSGTMGGPAIAETLLGKTSPSGKLPMSFPYSVGQIPIYYNHKHTGRPFGGDPDTKYQTRYLDAPNDPLFPFGFGLSYTEFTMSEPKLSTKELVQGSGENIEVQVTLENVGEQASEEVVQLYLAQEYRSVTPPVKELKKFTKVYLEPGEKKDLVFQISEEDLKFYNKDLDFVSEPGKFTVMVGSRSDATKDIDFHLLP